MTPPGTTTTAFDIQGMNCASCVAHVSKAARSLPGVVACTVNLARGRANVQYDPRQTTPDKIAGQITQSGYAAHAEKPGTVSGKRPEDDSRAWLRRAIAGLVLWLPVELLHWAMELFQAHWAAEHLVMIWVSLVTSTLCLAYVGGSFYRSAAKALMHGTTNMDTLIAMGASVAYGYSLTLLLGGLLHAWPMPMGDELYFMESSALLALISLGHYLEANARRSAGSAIRELLNLTPEVALRVVGNRESKIEDRGSKIAGSAVLHPSSSILAPGTEEIPVEKIHPADTLLLRPGDRVPVDGIVTEGNSSVDESMITGEPLPVTRSAGDKVIAGTLNVDGRLIIRATAVGADTALSQIVQLVENAQDSRPPVQQLADRISGVFVPAVLVIALLTGIGWFAWGEAHHWRSAVTWAQIAKATCSVLLVACPCALGLAVPAAIMVGTGLGARRGILIRDIDALQNAEKIDTVVLDKTGTITQGKPVVTAVSGVAMDADALLRLAAAAEQFSSHPIAKAIMNEARKRGVEIPQPEKFNNHPGFGVVAELEGRHLLVGNRAMLELPLSQWRDDAKSEPASTAATGQSADAKIEIPASLPASAGTMVYIAQINGDAGALLGHIEISDAIKPDSIAAIARLRGMGMKLVLLTGDNGAAAAAIAAEAGITEIHSDVRPDGKADVIRRLQERAKIEDRGSRIANRKSSGPSIFNLLFAILHPVSSLFAAPSRASVRVAMVGDGINDAPALASADVGIALGSGSDVAKETGDIVLVSGSLAGVSAAIVLSRATMRHIRQNLFLAFIYNVLAIPLAAFGLLHPVVAAAAMAMSDISVLGNSLRLRSTKIDG
jgi:Cu+-exporting ATPase